MAFPGRSGPLASGDGEEQMALAELHGRVVKLRLAGATWKLIAEHTRYSERWCRTIYRRALARTRGDRDIEAHRDEVFADLELVIEAIRPYAFGWSPLEDAVRPAKEDVELLMKVLGAKMKLLGLDKHAVMEARDGLQPKGPPPMTPEEREKSERDRAEFWAATKFIQEHQQEVFDWCDRKWGSPVEQYRRDHPELIDKFGPPTYKSLDATAGEASSLNEPPELAHPPPERNEPGT